MTAPRQPTAAADVRPRRHQDGAGRPRPLSLGVDRRDFHAKADRAAAVSGAHRLRPGLRGPGKPRRGACRSIKTPSRSSRPNGTGRSGQPTRRWPIGAWAAPSIAWAGSPRPKRITKRHSSSARRTPRSGTTRAIATISRGAGPMPSARSRRPPDSLPRTSEFAPTSA